METRPLLFAHIYIYIESQKHDFRNSREKQRLLWEEDKYCAKRATSPVLFLVLMIFEEGGPLMLENKFQANLIKKLKKQYPGCIVMKNDSSYIQGIPDLLMLHGKKWASLECKKTEKARHQPNQDYYVDKMNGMGFSSFIYPENEDDVLHDLSIYMATE